MDKKVTSPLVKALIISLLLAVLDMIAGFAKFKYATWFPWVSSILLLVAIMWACINYVSQNNGDVTFGNAFAHGFKVSAIAACFSIIFVILSIYIISPDTRDIVLERTRKQMEEKGNLSEENINAALDITRRLFLPFAIGGALIGTILVGTIGSLIGAAVAKKNPESSFENQLK
ncbi:MAG TPA: DUF4199 domain-containing protein [Puia sp.]|nr:DUF4199 domain-containing protein [Puia sp.]